MPPPLLSVNGLKKNFPIHGGIFYRELAKVHAVDEVSFEVNSGETLGLVGESGCGKSTVGRTLMHLYEPTAGEITFQGERLGKVGKEPLRKLRRNMQIIFQDPFESLNSRHTVGFILEEPFIIHEVGTASGRRAAVLKLLDRVGLNKNALHKFPHEFSGGQRQRIGIARAIALEPKLIICDEPVSALDVSIQSQILNLLLELQREMGLAYLFIAHDLAVVKHISDSIAVMYLGRIVELAKSEALYQTPLHPYTKALIRAIPVPDPTKRGKRHPIAGEVPSPISPPSGCHFHGRCPFADDLCKKSQPPLAKKAAGHLVACHHVEKILGQTAGAKD
jgi:oligopeptide/dipeptide ABC transporter ATP-binding protein